MTTIPISIRQVNPATERSTVVRLLTENLPVAATEGRFEWAYLQNPDGIAFVWLAETSDGEAVGTSAAFPRRFRVNDNMVQALVLSDFAIDRRFRTLGPAVALLGATLASIEGGSFEFALDYPSEAMSAVYKRLGATAIGRQTRYVRLLGLGEVAKRRLGAGHLATIVGTFGDFLQDQIDRFPRIPDGLAGEVYSGVFSDEFGKVGRMLQERRTVCGDRSPDYLNWRYRNGIRFDYVTVALRSENELIGYAILQQSDETSVTIVEFVCPEDSAIEDALFCALLDVCRRSDVESLQASCIESGAWCKVLKRLGFAAREQSTGPVVYVPKNAKWTEILIDNNQWWMTDGDRDG